ncbi:WXG100 family type VII secretion target [Nocardia sp. CDC159]|uniref:WXG100 family type VII secretion target n=1 Tax=Nocardia pulmonis TaxID=2951408 RepID=A0A9X2E9A4_9NOCA|nr:MULTISPECIES: WXG100 family type VII secretion target [Nocardia]MCM6776134.1 WXG100 family type VII secretion target [Nocardia pulmonis]MCM6788539.1 WXG100 family type VII secretion target [Nocardia sp. CDC159]
MAGNVTTDFAQMEASAKHVEDVNSQLQAELTRIQGAVDSAVHWKGDASGAFHGVMVEFQEASKRLNNTLQDIAGAIRQSGIGYTNAEEAIQQSIMKAGASGDLGAPSSLNIPTA